MIVYVLHKTASIAYEKVEDSIDVYGTKEKAIAAFTDSKQDLNDTYIYGDHDWKEETYTSDEHDLTFEMSYQCTDGDDAYIDLMASVKECKVQ